MPFDHSAVEDRLEASADAVAEVHKRKPTISEACGIADERERKALVAAFVEALAGCCTNPDCPKYRKP